MSPGKFCHRVHYSHWEIAKQAQCFGKVLACLRDRIALTQATENFRKLCGDQNVETCIGEMMGEHLKALPCKLEAFSAKLASMGAACLLIHPVFIQDLLCVADCGLILLSWEHVNTCPFTTIRAQTTL